MRIMKRYIFDLDNTLVYTDSLNNDSYNYALKKLGLASINDCKRITRDVILSKYPELNSFQKNEIIELKQKYFMNNLKRTSPNMSNPDQIEPPFRFERASVPEFESHPSGFWEPPE